MYAILVYDVGEDRIERLRKFLKKYMFWIQNSVFEGEISDYELSVITENIKNIIEEKDSVIIYIFRTDKEFKKLTLGNAKGKTDMII